MKNRHLIEISHSLMLNTNVPLHHWRDAILTDYLLINEMPSSSLERMPSYLENKVLTLIFPNETLYHVSRYLFGCTCFVHNVSPGLDKLFAKAIKCVFLGYSRLQEGYKCYSSLTRRYYISANVSFFEHSSFVQQTFLYHLVIHWLFLLTLKLLLKV